MAANIDHEDILDVRDLSDLALAQKAIIDDIEFGDEDDEEDAIDTLAALAEFLKDMGQPIEDVTDGEAISDALLSIMETSSPTLIADDYFAEAIESDFNDIYGLPNGLPAYVAVDWKKTAENAKVDYSRVTLDEKVYFIRK